MVGGEPIAAGDRALLEEMRERLRQETERCATAVRPTAGRVTD